MIDTLPSVELADPFIVSQVKKEMSLCAGLSALTEWHRERCSGYAAMLDAIYGRGQSLTALDQVPYLPTRIFKHLELMSVPRQAVVRQLTSSGTTGQQVSRIFLDAETSALQVRALAAIVQSFLGKQRLPMLIVDQQECVRGKAAFGARAAGILGFSNFGHHHLYALDDSMQPRWDQIREFLERFHGTPVLLFGFTWVIWQCFLQAAVRDGQKMDFGPQSILVHGGGWKRLADQSVDNPTFKQRLAEQFGIRRVSNYYGMVEQVGSIFMECEEGYFHIPAFADVLMRDIHSLEPVDSGAVEVLSLLPRSYPGHAILTEDLGTVLGRDDCPCGRKGKYIRIHGRIPKAEMRGCSDVRAI
jgi:hypothetical protein